MKIKHSSGKLITYRVKTFINLRGLPRHYKRIPFKLKGYWLFFDNFIKKYHLYSPIRAEAVAAIREIEPTLTENYTKQLVLLATVQHPGPHLVQQVRRNLLKTDVRKHLRQVHKELDKDDVDYKRHNELQQEMNKELNTYLVRNRTHFCSVPLNPLRRIKKQKVMFVSKQTGKVLGCHMMDKTLPSAPPTSANLILQP